jgi:hypothetical protein
MSIIKDMGKGSGISLPCGAEAIVEGYVYKADGTTNQMIKITGKADTAFAIALTTTLDPQTGEAKTMTAGDNWGFALLGSKMVVTVASKTGTTYQSNAKVYLCDDVDGMANATADTSTPIGHYAGPDALVTTTSGQLIQVYLDIGTGAAAE